MTTTPWYDTREGLDERLQNGLDGLRAIVRARREAGYDRKERMAEWCLLGLFYTDTCGNTSLLTRGAPADTWHIQAADLEPPPSVMPRADLERYTGHWTGVFREIPPAEARCDRCGEGWTLRNVKDFMWLRDDGPLPVSRARHRSCHRLVIIEREQREIATIVARSEIPHGGLYMIPNQYHPDPDVYGPWFMLGTTAGRIKIGWRKRVINIDWSETSLRAQGSEIVAEPGITHGASFVHAYGADAAVEALRRLWKGGIR